jgi:hypothetical protein
VVMVENVLLDDVEVVVAVAGDGHCGFWFQRYRKRSSSSSTMPPHGDYKEVIGKTQMRYFTEKILSLFI